MSAILDALKKLEAESTSPGSDDGTAVSFPKSSRARPVFVIAGGVVLFLVFAAGIWKLTPLLVNPVVATAPTAKSRVRLDLPARQQDRGQQSDQSQAALLAQTEPAAADTDKAASSPGADESASPDESQASVREAQSGIKVGQQAENESKSREAIPPSASDKKDISKKPASKDSSGTKHEFEPEIMEDGPLTLQAISWADAPEKRIAVINGKICRQKERIDGYRIQRINPDDVRVTDGEKTWRLSFGIR